MFPVCGFHCDGVQIAAWLVEKGNRNAITGSRIQSGIKHLAWSSKKVKTDFASV